jgi:hypothetical protein
MESVNALLNLIVLERFLGDSDGNQDKDLVSLILPFAIIGTMQGSSTTGAGTMGTGGSGEQLTSLLTTVAAFSLIRRNDSGSSGQVSVRDK